MKLSGEMPRTLVTNLNVAHLVWLLHNENARRCWNSVYHNIFAQAVEVAPYEAVNAMSKALQITVEPPDIGFCSLSVNTFSQDGVHVITRINGYTLTDFPFKKVSYTHPSIKEVKTIAPKEGTRRIVPKDDGEDFELDGERRPAKRDSEQPLAEIPTTTIEFQSSLRFVRVPQGEVLISRSNPGLTPTGAGSKVKIKETDKTVSTDEPVYGGKIQPIEFAGLEMARNVDESGLKEFLEAVQNLKQDYPHLIVEYTIIDVMGDKPFCLADGAKRVCAIIEVSRPDLAPCYIFEFSRPDEWSISTLFVRIRSQASESIQIGQKALTIISNAVAGNGHWILEKFTSDTSIKPVLLKHIQNNTNWSRRIMKKLETFGFSSKDL